MIAFSSFSNSCFENFYVYLNKMSLFISVLFFLINKRKTIKLNQNGKDFV